MAVSLQVIYPVTADSTFDYDYYLSTHLPLVDQHWSDHIQSVLVTKGLAGGPDTPPGSHAIATLLFKDQGAFDAAMAVAKPVLADIPNFTNSQPQMLIGEVIA